MKHPAYRLLRIALMAGLLTPALASAQQEQQGRGGGVGVGGRAATSAQPGLGPSTDGRSGTDDCNQANRTGSDCSPSSVGDSTLSQPGPAGGDTAVPTSGSTGSSTGTSASPGGNQRSPSDPSSAR
jgi:hypothetical protein